jgi:Arc/MetJ-type ribon-helix-helix transcriptional regulator
MPASRIAVTVDEKLLREVDSWVREGKYPSRSRAIQAALEEKLRRQRRLLEALAEADPEEARSVAEESIGVDEWPEY